MKIRDWHGPVAFVLAVGVAVALVGGTLTAELTPHKITSEEIAFLSTLGGAAVGAVAAYLGIRSVRTPADPPYLESAPEPEPEEESEP